MTQKLALITGASRGLGHALALELAKSHHIIAVARTIGALEELDDAIKSLGGAATLAPMDIASSEAMAQLCRSIHDRWGQVDIWAHCAVHAAPLGPAITIDAKDMSKSIDINVTAAARLITYVAPLLGEESHALFFDDTHVMEKFHGAYCATKSAQITLAKQWQKESQKIGPRIHISAPPPMATATRARFFPGEDRAPLASAQEVASSILREAGLGGDETTNIKD